MPRYSETYYNEEYYTQTLFEAGFTIGVLRGTAVVYSLLESKVFIKYTEGDIYIDEAMYGKVRVGK